MSEEALSDYASYELGNIEGFPESIEAYLVSGLIALETKLSNMEGVVKAAGNWDRAHPNPHGHCDNDDLRQCVTAYALKEALREV